MATIGHNSQNRVKYTSAEIDFAIREKIRKDNIRDDSTYMQRARWELWLSRLSPRAKLVGFAIWEHADKGGGNAFPSMKRLLVMVGGSERDLSMAIKEFAEWEFAMVIPGRGKRSNEYRFCLSHQKLSDYVGDNVVAIRKQSSPSDTTVVALGDTDRDNGTTTVVAHGNDGDFVALPKSELALPSASSSTTIAYIRTRASDLTDLTDLTGEVAHTREEDTPIEGMLGKVAASFMAGAAMLSPMAAAAQTMEHPAIVQQAPASCWQTAEAKYAASLNSHEAMAQKQVWITPSGLLEVSGEFRAELERVFPEVDLISGLAASAPNASNERSALRMMQVIRRQFGFMRQDVLKRAKAIAAGQAQSKQPERKPVRSFADQEADSHREWIYRDAARIAARGPIIPGEGY